MTDIHTCTYNLTPTQLTNEQKNKKIKKKIPYQLQTITTSFTMMNNIIHNPRMAHPCCVRISQGGQL